MGWTDTFPVFTDELVEEFEANATPQERVQLDEWYGEARVLNPQPECQDIVSVSLFWKNVRAEDPELPSPTRELLQRAQELGLARRFNPWDHYVRPLLEEVPRILSRFPGVSVRVHLAEDLGFLAEELAEAGNEVHVMNSSSVRFAPGGLWRFLPFEESGKRITVTDIDRLNELEGDLARSRTMEQAGVGAWRVPVPVDLAGDRCVSYLPFMGCQFGVAGGLIECRKLMDAFTWHARRGTLETMVIFPGCGPLPIQAHTWPSYGFDEYFMTLAAYPRLAQYGMLTFVPTFTKSQLLALDVEYVTWGNPNSELVYFPVASCCDVKFSLVTKPAGTQRIDIRSEASVESGTDKDPVGGAGTEPTVAFLFLTRGGLNHPVVWRRYLESSNGRHRVFTHAKDPAALFDCDVLQGTQIKEHHETAWGSISLVQATLALLRAALDDPECTHFVLVSESCVPVRSFGSFSTSLRLEPRSRMRVEPWEEVRRKNLLKAQRVENIPGIRKEFVHFQDQWMCLDRRDALLVIGRDWTAAFAGVFAPDEIYFATVMALEGSSPLQSLANRSVTWTMWSEGESHPQEFVTVSPRVAGQIIDSGCYFARKFAPSSDISTWDLDLM